MATAVVASTAGYGIAMLVIKPKCRVGSLFNDAIMEGRTQSLKKPFAIPSSSTYLLSAYGSQWPTIVCHPLRSSSISGSWSCTYAEELGQAYLAAQQNRYSRILVFIRVSTELALERSSAVLKKGLSPMQWYLLMHAYRHLFSGILIGIAEMPCAFAGMVCESSAVEA